MHSFIVIPANTVHIEIVLQQMLKESFMAVIYNLRVRKCEVPDRKWESCSGLDLTPDSSPINYVHQYRGRNKGLDVGREGGI